MTFATVAANKKLGVTPIACLKFYACAEVLIMAGVDAMKTRALDFELMTNILSLSDIAVVRKLTTNHILI